MIVYRIAHRKYAYGLSVSGLEGRWNSGGKQVLYTSENVSLALLENLIYRAGFGFNGDYKIMIIQIPDQKMEEILVKNLPNNWRAMEAYPQLQKAGDAWYESRSRLCLKVPSSVIPDNFNIILNAAHTDFKDVKLIATLDYEPDERLEKILKQHR